MSNLQNRDHEGAARSSLFPHPAGAADQTGVRLHSAAAVVAELATAAHGIRPAQIDSADSIAVVPGFKRGAPVVDVGFGRGFISCRMRASRSAPGAIARSTPVDGQIASAEPSFRTGSRSARTLPRLGEIVRPPMATPVSGSSFLAAPRARNFRP
jgi:hypothetical protein